MFSARAWLHWKFLCRNGSTEACAFGVTAEDDWLRVERLWVPKQECTSVTCKPDDHELSDAMMDLSCADLNPHRVCHVWLHTHPAMSANPSGTDEETFREVYGKVSDLQWVVMGILSKTDDVYARIQYRQTMAQHVIPVEVDWDSLPDDAVRLAADMAGWRAEYDAKVREKKFVFSDYAAARQAYWHAGEFGVGGFADGPTATVRAEDTGRIIRPDPEPDPGPGPSRDEALKKFAAWLKERYGLDSLTVYDDETVEELLDEFEEETGVVVPEEDEDQAHWQSLDDNGLYLGDGGLYMS